MINRLLHPWRLPAGEGDGRGQPGGAVPRHTAGHGAGGCGRPGVCLPLPASHCPGSMLRKRSRGCGMGSVLRFTTQACALPAAPAARPAIPPLALASHPTARPSTCSRGAPRGGIPSAGEGAGCGGQQLQPPRERGRRPGMPHFTTCPARWRGRRATAASDGMPSALVYVCNHSLLDWLTCRLKKWSK